MAERSKLINPYLCINPGVIESTGGRGYCNPLYGKKYRGVAGECGECPKPGREGLRSNGRDFMTETERREKLIERLLQEDRIKRNAKVTGKYLRM